MTIVKTVHHGGIVRENKLVETFAAPSRPILMKNINMWFFDYFYSNKCKIIQLPPLDDWTHSQEDDTYWSIKFPDLSWIVWVRYEPLEFR